jgi:hypothetical protein
MSPSLLFHVPYISAAFSQKSIAVILCVVRQHERMDRRGRTAVCKVLEDVEVVESVGLRIAFAGSTVSRRALLRALGDRRGG